MKNKLPNPVQVDTHGSIAFKINQLIDYLAELTEVVDKLVTIVDDVENTPPSLKETLLGEIGELPDYGKVLGSRGKSFTIARSDVEAIINRLMP